MKHFKALVEKEDVYIEGFANSFQVDREFEKVDPISLQIENFLLNKQLLFNHDTDLVIGGVVEVKRTEKGVWVRAKLSRSNDSQVSYVRDMVKEGFLRAFSIRFDKPTWVQDPENPKILIAKEAELLEVSIVTIPCQPQSLFSIVKSFNFSKCKNVEEAKGQVMRQKGMLFAEAVAEMMATRFENPEAEKDKVLASLAEASGVAVEVVAQACAGELTPVPESLASAIAAMFEVDPERMAELVEVDANREAEAAETQEEEQDSEDEIAADDKNEDDETIEDLEDSDSEDEEKGEMPDEDSDKEMTEEKSLSKQNPSFDAILQSNELLGSIATSLRTLNETMMRVLEVTEQMASRSAEAPIQETANEPPPETLSEDTEIEGLTDDDDDDEFLSVDEAKAVVEAITKVASRLDKLTLKQRH